MLSGAAIARARSASADKPANPHVICGHRHGARLINLNDPWDEIRKKLGFPDAAFTICGIPSRACSRIGRLWWSCATRWAIR